MGIINTIRQGLCCHYYDTVETAVVHVSVKDTKENVYIGKRITCLCKKCGKTYTVRTYSCMDAFRARNNHARYK